MDILENFTDKNGVRVQPYFAAFMIEYGFDTLEEANEMGPYFYMEWNQKRWREYERLSAIGSGFRPFHRKEFHFWLNGLALDKLAQRYVEQYARDTEAA